MRKFEADLLGGVKPPCSVIQIACQLPRGEVTLHVLRLRPANGQAHCQQTLWNIPRVSISNEGNISAFLWGGVFKMTMQS